MIDQGAPLLQHPVLHSPLSSALLSQSTLSASSQVWAAGAAHSLLGTTTVQLYRTLSWLLEQGCVPLPRWVIKACKPRRNVRGAWVGCHVGL